MNWVFFLLMLSMTLITYKMNRGCYIAPSVIVSGMTTLSALVITVNARWDYTLSLATVCIIAISVLMFNIGQGFGERVVIKTIPIKTRNISNYSLIRPQKAFYYFALIFGIITLALYFYQQLRNAAQVGMAGSFASIIEANRYMVENGADSSIIRLLFVCLKAIAYVTLAVFISEKISGNMRTPTVKTFMIAGLYFACAILTTNRSDIIAAAGTMAFYVLYFIYQKNKWRAKTVKMKTLMKVFMILCVAVLAFRMLGYLTGKSENSSFFDNISVYIGSSFVCLDKVVTGTGIVPDEINVVLFDGFWNLLKMAGIDFKFPSTAMPHQHWGTEFSSNVYSSLFPYLMKFGVFGLFLIQFMIGMLYGLLWRKIRTSNVSWVGLMVYAHTFFYYICMYSIAERITAQFISLTTFVEIMALWILVKAFTKRKMNIENVNLERIGSD